MPDLSCLKRENAPDLAYVYVPASGSGKDSPVVMFCSGFKSDMEGTKALYLQEQCQKRGQGYVRFDYRGHGQSDGKFEDGTISLWKQDAMDIMDHIKAEHFILVGSSMGGWISLLLLEARKGSIAGMVGIAAAPDFTRSFRDETFTAELRAEIKEKGYVALPNDYSDEPYIITNALIEDGENNLFMDRSHNIDVPVRLVQGMQDTDVPWQTAHRIKNNIEGDVEAFLVEDADHRMSRDEDLTLIDAQIRAINDLVKK